MEFRKTNKGQDKTYRVVYAVHEVIEPASTNGLVQGETRHTADQADPPTEFIGCVNLKSLEAGGLDLPDDLTLPAAAASTTLTVELSYSFLPTAWRKGYATESVKAVFEACKQTPSFWSPYEKVYVRAIVNHGNPASIRVMNKTGLRERGVYVWTGRIFLAGEWRVRDDLHIFGTHLLE